MCCVADRMTHRLRQCGRGQQRGNQHHAADVAGGDRIPQRADLGRVRPRHPGRGQLVAAGDRAFSGAD